MNFNISAIVGFAAALAVSVAAQARDFEIGGSSDYQIMAPERGSAPHHVRRQGARRHVKARYRRPLAERYKGVAPDKHLSVVRGSSGSVLPTPLPKTELIPPESTGKLALPSLPQQQGPSIVPGVAHPVPNLPHGPESFQDRASRCSFQAGLYNVPGTARSRYIGNCVQ